MRIQELFEFIDKAQFEVTSNLLEVRHLNKVYDDDDDDDDL